jgi:hypothetical protein
VTAHKHRPLQPRALAAVLALAAGPLGFPACSHDREADRTESPDRAPTAGRQRSTPPGVHLDGAATAPRVRAQFAAGTPLDHAAQAELAATARRFATTLAGWLYGHRRETDVECVTSQLRQELAIAPPYIPEDQIGSADGRATQIRVSVQTPRSGVLVVTIRDSRTSYRIPASFELRAGRWQVVHLNTH